MTGVRLPASAATSFAIHAGFFGAYLFLAQSSKDQNLRVVANVDLLVQVKRPAALPAMPVRKTAAPPSMMDFMKMALPSIPRVALPQAPQEMSVKLPETHKPLMAEPEKLKDRGRMAEMPKLDALDLTRQKSSVSALKINDTVEAHHAAVSALASLPRLEEVGTRRVKNLPQALALEEGRQRAVALQQIGSAEPATARHVTPTQAMNILREASPPERGALGDKMAAVVAQGGGIDLHEHAAAMPAPMRPAIAPAVHATPRRQTQAIDVGKKKSVEIEGPLADRKVVYYEVPPFPSWASAQGILEADVSIRFYVSPAGDVLSDPMRVESTSGEGRLDRLAMDALKNWKFVPISGGERQWGVITFRFVVE